MMHPHTIDRPIAALVTRLPNNVSPVMKFASFIAAPLASGIILLVIVAFLFLAGNEELFKSGLAILLLTPLAELSKYITRRHRPETIYVEHMRFKTYSFPSGHSYIAALIFGFMGSITATWQSYGWLLTALMVGLIFTVGVSRIYLGAHFPSDVIAGWMLGGITLYLVSRIG